MRHRIKLLFSRLPGIEAMEADTDLAFARHTHEQFGVGLIERGAQKSASGRGTVEAGAGDLITVNPGEVHDGAPIGERGRKWRMLYVDPALVSAVLVDMTDSSLAAGREFTQPRLRDAVLATRFRMLFEGLTDPDAAAGKLSAQETSVLLLAGLLRPAAPPPVSVSVSVPAGVSRARTRIDDEPTADLTLPMLAAEAGLSQYQFLRAFARATGLTPHAYVVQRRVHRARQRILSGMPLADAALCSGFADQSHMTRHFVRRYGFGPGAYARSVR